MDVEALEPPDIEITLSRHGGDDVWHPTIRFGAGQVRWALAGDDPHPVKLSSVFATMTPAEAEGWKQKLKEWGDACYAIVARYAEIIANGGLDDHERADVEDAVRAMRPLLALAFHLHGHDESVLLGCQEYPPVASGT